MVAMNPTQRIPAALAFVTVAVIGCGQPSGGPTRGAGAAQEEASAPQPPVEVSGRITCGPPVRSGSEVTVEVGDEGILTRHRDGAWRQTVTMSDPRLEGTVYHTFEADTYATPDGEGRTEVWAATRRIENEAGSWEVQGFGGSYPDGTPIANTAAVYIGKGAYEGLIAIMDESPLEDACGAEVRGLIFDGAPVPEPYVPG
jgi:hypothetical protein